MKNIFNRNFAIAAAAALTMNSAPAKADTDVVAACIPKTIAMLTNSFSSTFKIDGADPIFSQGLVRISEYQAGKVEGEAIIEENPQNHHVTIQYWSMVTGSAADLSSPSLNYPIQMGAIFIDKDVEYGNLSAQPNDLPYILERGMGWHEQIRAEIGKLPNELGCGEIKTIGNPGCKEWQQQALKIMERGEREMFQNERHDKGQAFNILRTLRDCVSDSSSFDAISTFSP
jgi:hypothetical protein